MERLVSHAAQARRRAKPGWPEAPPILEEVYTMEDALTFGGACISLLNHADRVKVGLPGAAGQRHRADHDGDRRPGVAADDLPPLRADEQSGTWPGAAVAGELTDILSSLLHPRGTNELYSRCRTCLISSWRASITKGTRPDPVRPEPPSGRSDHLDLDARGFSDILWITRWSCATTICRLQTRSRPGGGQPSAARRRASPRRTVAGDTGAGILERHPPEDACMIPSRPVLCRPACRQEVTSRLLGGIAHAPAGIVLRNSGKDKNGRGDRPNSGQSRNQQRRLSRHRFCIFCPAYYRAFLAHRRGLPPPAHPSIRHRDAKLKTLCITENHYGKGPLNRE